MFATHSPNRLTKLANSRQPLPSTELPPVSFERYSLIIVIDSNQNPCYHSPCSSPNPPNYLFPRSSLTSPLCSLLLQESTSISFQGTYDPFVFILLRTLLHCRKSYLQSFHHLPHSFRETPGRGVPLQPQAAYLSTISHLGSFRYLLTSLFRYLFTSLLLPSKGGSIAGSPIHNP